MSNVDVSVKSLSHQNIDGLKLSQLVLKFEGNDMNHTIVNTLRRVPYESVPTYAFDRSMINIALEPRYSFGQFTFAEVPDTPTSLFKNPLIFLILSSVCPINFNIFIVLLEI